jgi:hypothetical protein
MIRELVNILRRWTRSRCRDPNATLRATSVMGVRVPLNYRHARPEHPACSMCSATGALCTPQSVTHSDCPVCPCLCSAGRGDCEKLPATPCGATQLQVGMRLGFGTLGLSGANVMGNPGSCRRCQATSATADNTLTLVAAPPTAWRRSCTTGRRSIRR